MIAAKFLLGLVIIQQVASKSYEHPANEYGGIQTRQPYKLGEFNDKCKVTKDCRDFGYVCRDNKTCQCDFMYIPSADKKTCVGGVNQRCHYDEHCIQGAFCMNQEVCKCKQSSPIELDYGLVCSDGETVALNIYTLLSTAFLLFLLL